MSEEEQAPEPEEEETSEYTEIEATTPFGGENFVLTVDGNPVRLPCKYRTLIETGGFELLDGPDPYQSLDGEGQGYQGYEEFATLVLPGYSDAKLEAQMKVASYRLDEDGSHVYIKENGNQKFEADSYGDCIAFHMFLISYKGDDLDEFSQYVFPCGVTIGMTRDEVIERWGSPYTEMNNGQVIFLDGDQGLAIHFRDDGKADIIDIFYDHEMASMY